MGILGISFQTDMRLNAGGFEIEQAGSGLKYTVNRRIRAKELRRERAQWGGTIKF